MSLYDLLNALAMLELTDGVIAFPTDTVYGIGCLLDKPDALIKMARLKGWESPEPLVLLGRSRDDLLNYIQCPSPWMMACANELMKCHWPGPVTLVLPKSEILPPQVAPVYPTVGIRVPDCNLLLDMLTLIPSGVLATTSACRKDQAPCLTACAVREEFGDALDYILADDFCIRDKTPSTVVAIEGDGTVQVLRSGKTVLN